MASWWYTYIEKAESVSDSSIEAFIRKEPKEACSLARDNREYWFRDRSCSEWVLITPNGFQSLDEKYAESCKEMSRHFDTRVVVTVGQGNCSGIAFALFDKGELKRFVGVVDTMIYSNVGEPMSWEPEVFGDLSGEEAGISEATLSQVAETLNLPGYTSDSSSDGYWSKERKVLLMTPPPLPA